MRTTAIAAFPGWLAQFEGDLPGLYRDAKGLPTVGLAYLIPLSTALGLAWTLPSGALASPADIHAAYDRLFVLPAGMGGGWYQSRLGLFLSPHSAALLFVEKVRSFEAALRSARHIGPEYDALPAVCQIARMRSAWADGGESSWPKLDAALARGDWRTAAEQCWPKDAGPDPWDPATAGRRTTQPREYTASYCAVRGLYLLADVYPGDELPESLPDGDEGPASAA